MVSKRTVLVVGAGGSMPYDYPSGQKLVYDIASQLGRPTALGNLMRDLEFTNDAQLAFARTLRRSHAGSIDAFLELNDEFLAIGKAAIAASLAPLEEEEALLRKPDWYHYLAQKIISNLKNGTAEQLTVVTFNYDRSLDYSLKLALENHFPASTAAKFSALLKIIHVHGSLCPLPGDANSSEPYRSYGDSSVERIQQSAKSIKIIHEHNDDSPELGLARAELMAAERVCFLGFGFHPTNVRRLLIGGWVSRLNFPLYGSAFDMTNAERSILAEPFNGKLHFTDRTWGCLTFLREHAYYLR
ncbi:hypothetical protein CMV30_18970 [Nibricoccus aquaticus]|uniref:SIR2-like domain-containing protein n=1 Tax=Nibricoccus aquaticus TaxID=2576891 RepID=A0A290QF45_9BACT|nr:hypothetical protein [Nibricoccus aquaticus]ATC65860.1 hypothetical protein CMV30_18970 [Nibricoccus aquaticus]